MSTRVINFDWAIKYILRDKENFGILDGFLSALLKKDITVLEIIEPESSSESKEVKINRVDLMVRSEDEQFIIEIQNAREVDYLERILFGTSKVIVETIPSGAKYRDINKVISVNILYFNLGKGEDYAYHGKTDFFGINKGDKLNIRRRVFINDKEFVFEEKNIFPEYYLIRVEHFEEIIGSDLDEWIYMFKTGIIKDDFNSKGMELVRKKLSYLNMGYKEQRAYDKYMVDLEREEDMLNSAEEDGYLRAKKEDKALVKEALEEKEEALKEKEEALNRERKVIITMYQQGSSLEEIAKLFNKTVIELEKLIK